MCRREDYDIFRKHSEEHWLLLNVGMKMTVSYFGVFVCFFVSFLILFVSCAISVKSTPTPAQFEPLHQNASQGDQNSGGSPRIRRQVLGEF